MSRINVLLLGPESCGKTTFLNNCLGKISSSHPTLGINIEFSPTARLQEITGNSRFEHIINAVLKDDGIDVVVFLFRKGYREDLKYIKRIYNTYLSNKTLKYMLVSTHHDISYRTSLPKKCEHNFEQKYLFELDDIQRLLQVDDLFTVDKYGTNTKRFMEHVNTLYKHVVPQTKARYLSCFCC